MRPGRPVLARKLCRDAKDCQIDQETRTISAPPGSPRHGKRASGGIPRFGLAVQSQRRDRGATLARLDGSQIPDEAPEIAVCDVGSFGVGRPGHQDAMRSRQVEAGNARIEVMLEVIIEAPWR